MLSPCQALELISNEVGPDEPAPSQGNNNPAVMKYDPTGLRTTMSTTNKAWEESLKVSCLLSLCDLCFVLCVFLWSNHCSSVNAMQTNEIVANDGDWGSKI